MKQPLQERVARIVANHSIDLVLLAECAEPPDTVLHALGSSYLFPQSLGDKVRIFIRAGSGQVIDQFNDPTGGLTIRRLQLPQLTYEIILAVSHFPSRINYDRDDQTLEATVLVQDICRVEDEFFHSRTLLVGDFNMNPFDTGMIGAQALHGVMTKNLARREERDVRGRSYRLFYKPMWGHFGDRTNGPPGTYYLSSSNPQRDFPLYAQLHLEGKLDLARLVSRTYPLEGINDAFAEMLSGKIARAVIVF